ncbi:MAG: FtsX-like permease family protein [Sarcina sp.]
MKNYKDIVNREFKVKKKKSYIAIIGIFLGVMLLSAVLNFFSFDNKRYQNDSRASGEQEVIYEYDEKVGDARDKLLKNVYVDSLGFYRESEVMVEDKEIMFVELDDTAINEFFDYGLSLAKVDLNSLKEDEVYISDVVAASGYKVGDEIKVEDKKYKVKGIFRFYWRREAIFKKYTPKAGDKSDVVVSVKGDSDEIVNNINAITKALNYEVMEGSTPYMGIESYKNVRVNHFRLSVFYAIENLMAVVQLLIVVLIVLITVVSSYGLVNFSIADKKKQFGILRCIGASPGQIRALIYKEVFMLGVQAVIPAIIVGNIISYGLINYLTGKEIFNSYGVGFAVSIGSIIVAILIALLTIFLASIMPAIKAGKVTPIESTKGILGKQKIKKIGFLSRFIRKRFGIETEIAYRNLKANKSMFYVSTILLVVCFVSFITLSFVTDNFIAGYDRGIMADYDYTVQLGTNIDTDIEDSQNYKYEKQLEGKSKEEIKEFTKVKSKEYIDLVKEDVNELEEFLGEYTTGAVAKTNVNNFWLDNILVEGLSLKEECDLSDYSIKQGTENEFSGWGQIIVYNEEYFDKMKDKIRGDFTYQEFKKDGVILIDNVTYSLPQRITKLFDNKKGDKLTMRFKTYDNLEHANWNNKPIEEFKKEADQKIDMTVMGSIRLKQNMIWSGNLNEGIAMIVSEEFFNEHAAAIKSNDLDLYTFFSDFNFNLKKGVNQEQFANLLTSKFDSESEERHIYLSNNIKERKGMMEIEKITRVVLYGFLTMVISILVMSVLINKKMSIEARKKEYGGLLAIGMSRDKISKTILYEGLIQAIMVFVIAIPLTVMIIETIVYFGQTFITTESVSVWLWAIAIIAVIAVTFITSLLPLSMFKKLDIISMIKGEE